MVLEPILRPAAGVICEGDLEHDLTVELLTSTQGTGAAVGAIFSTMGLAFSAR